MTASPNPSAHPETSGVCIPQHVAIIMDGNGRWAQSRGMSRTEGHKHGLDALRGAIRYAARTGIDYITIFSFSSENWSRPETEIKFLLSLLRRFVQRDLLELHQANIRIRVIGERDSLEPGIRTLLEEAENLTRDNTGMTLVVAFNYGARDELTRAVKSLVARAESGQLTSDDVDEELISSALDTGGIPDPDLIIRTSGELRLSNFLLWQAAYTEFYFAEIYWPDFDDKAFDEALADYANRNRRFGGLTASAL